MMTRRQWLKLSAGAVGTGFAAKGAAECPSTPRMGFGPFYPDSPIPKVVDLTNGGRAKGETILVFGRILDRQCRPIVGASVEIWQCDNKGHYKHGRTDSQALDPGFTYFSHAISDQEGAYYFQTLMPVRYGTPGFSRAPHIHYRIHKQGFKELATEMHFAGDRFAALRDGDSVLDSVPSRHRDALIAEEIDPTTIPQLKPWLTEKKPCRQFDVTLDLGD